MLQHFLLFIATLVLPGLNTLAAQNVQVQPQPSIDYLDDEAALKQAAFERQQLRMSIPLSPEQAKYDVKYYKLDLKLDPVAEIITGIVTIEAVSLVDSLIEMELDMSDSLEVTGITGDVLGGFSHTNDKLKITLPNGLAKDTLFSVEVSYTGSPLPGGLGGWGFDVHGGGHTPIIWSLSEPYDARGWWPCKDHPSDKADSVDLVLKVPDNLYAASNGLLTKVVDDEAGWHSYYWHHTYPISTYLISVAVTNYEISTQYFNYSPTDSMPITYYMYPENAASVLNYPPPTLATMEFFHNTFGPYPFLREKYGIAQFSWGGGMEHQTITSQGNFGEGLTVHELAHQWWGDKITNATWGDIWLNEGFATYSSALFIESYYGQDSLAGHMKLLSSEFPYSVFVDDTTDAWRIFNRVVYHKGAWVLHMLRHVVGDTAFFNTLRSYAADSRFAYGNATTDDFKSVCEDVSGMDLQYFFDDWIYQVGRPAYGADWTNIDTAATPQLYLRIDQHQNTGLLFRMPIDVVVSTLSGDTAFTIFNDEPNQVFTIPISSTATNVMIDPDNWILKGQLIISRVDEADPVPASYSLAQNYPNPFNPGTIIEYYLPATAPVNLSIYNLKGQLVTTLVDKNQVKGYHSSSWNGVDRFGRQAANGLYFYRLTSGDFVETKKMIILR